MFFYTKYFKVRFRAIEWLPCIPVYSYLIPAKILNTKKTLFCRIELILFVVVYKNYNVDIFVVPEKKIASIFSKKITPKKFDSI